MVATFVSELIVSSLGRGGADAALVSGPPAVPAVGAGPGAHAANTHVQDTKAIARTLQPIAAPPIRAHAGAPLDPDGARLLLAG
jgi:hypothetical protein